tara:strand:+ start:301 stop:522 length:222 start_codon:yes stop_codon:yes gene_type:complete
MSFDMKMRLNDTDISRLVAACLLYQERTGSEYMWEQYDDLINKLNAYQDNYSADENPIRVSSNTIPGKPCLGG